MTAGWNQQPPSPVHRVMAWSLPLLAFVTVPVVLAAACGGGGARDRPATPTQTASAAAGDFPQESDWRDCVLNGGGPAPGFSVEGRCASESVAEGDGLRATEVQEWRCEDFSGLGPGYEPCSGEFGRYTVVSIVRAGTSEVVSASGQLPPGAVE
jgi:hypothetical protein